jgi:hypothetical protein
MRGQRSLVRVPDNFSVFFYVNHGEVLLHDRAWNIYIPFRRGYQPLRRGYQPEPVRPVEIYRGGQMVPNYFCWYENNSRLHDENWYEPEFGNACGIFTVGPNSQPITDLINLRQGMTRIRDLFRRLDSPSLDVHIHWAACRED